MASSGKKGKKSKGKVISLQSFLSNGDVQPGVTQVTTKMRTRGTESDGEEEIMPQTYQLPTAPRASRIFDDDSVPHKPPFLAYISNLPFDINTEDVYDFFDVPIVSLRLPREDGDTGRVRGFGYIEFDTRDDLIHAISLPDPQIRNRRIRIDVSNESEQQQGQKRGLNNRSRYDGFGNNENRENRESTNWRRDGDNNQDEDRRGGYDRNRGYNRERRDGSSENSSWRTAERSNYDSSPRRGGYNGDRYRDGPGRRNDDFRRQGGNRSDEEVAQERPKLNLKPRTLPLPEIVQKPEEEEIEPERKPSPVPEPKPTGIPAENVFGAAKPVDTAAKEREIEERLEKERLRKLESAKDEENNLPEKLAEVKIAKDDDQENKNNFNSWRRRDADDDDEEPRNTAPRGNGDRDNRDRRDYHRGTDRDRNYRDRAERSDRDNYNRDRENTDVRTKEEKPRREPKQDRPSAKFQTSPSAPVTAPQPSNKYFGLLDEEDGSD